MKITDLTQKLSSKILVYPGDDGITYSRTAELPQTTYIQTGSHIGTHIDAPCHMLKGGKGIDEYPLSTFKGKAWCAMPEITDNRISAPDIPPADCEILIICTQWHRSTINGKSFLLDFPGFSDELAEYILRQGFKLVGTDIPSVDIDKDFHVHKKLLAADIPIVEGLINLKDLIGKTFEFTAFPLCLEGCDSSPVRAAASEN